MIEMIAERFNYAVVIVLMMTGLYVVFSTGNLIKKLVGLSVFQTSVFLLYISIGKVAGGQPPILEPHHAPVRAETEIAETADYGASAETIAPAADETPPATSVPALERSAAPADSTDDAPLAGDTRGGAGQDEALTVETTDTASEPAPAEAEAQADSSAGTVSEAELESDIGAETETPQLAGPAVEDAVSPEEAMIEAAPRVIAEKLAPASEATAYSNPLPHVLILTAIVVGVATLAVGLALVVRIRETYGSIEDEAISRADYETVAGAS